MNFSFGIRSLILFALSVVFLVLLTLLESSLIGIPMTVERVISFLLLVLPGLIGILLAVMGIVRKESKTWIAWLGVLLNALFAFFHLFVLSFAG
jgi:hypothetical protein